jgi:hypothetical protein
MLLLVFLLILPVYSLSKISRSSVAGLAFGEGAPADDCGGGEFFREMLPEKEWVYRNVPRVDSCSFAVGCEDSLQ